MRTTTSWGFNCTLLQYIRYSRIANDIAGLKFLGGLGAGLGAATEVRMASDLSEATPDRAIRFLSRELLTEGLLVRI